MTMSRYHIPDITVSCPADLEALMVPETITSWRILLYPLDLQIKLIHAFPETCVKVRYHTSCLDREVKERVESWKGRISHIPTLEGGTLAHLLFLEALDAEQGPEIETLLQHIFSLEGGTLLAEHTAQGHYPVDLLPKHNTHNFEKEALALVLQHSPWEKMRTEPRLRFWRKAFSLADRAFLSSLMTHDLFKHDVCTREWKTWRSHPFWIALYHADSIIDPRDPLNISQYGTTRLFDCMTFFTDHMIMEAMPRDFHATWMTFSDFARRLFLKNGFFERLGIKVGARETDGSPSAFARGFLEQALRLSDVYLLRDALEVGFTWEEVCQGTGSVVTCLRALAFNVSAKQSEDVEWLQRELVARELDTVLPLPAEMKEHPFPERPPHRKRV